MKKLMISAFRVAPILLMTLFAAENSYAASSENSACSEEDIEYAAFWDDAYVPQEAEAFGVEIQEIVRDKDLNRLFALVDGEVDGGPRRSFIAGKSFDEIFDEDWIRLVLEEPAPCSPVGWRGFMLGRGMIWYEKREDTWQISGINGALDEPVRSDLSAGWSVDGKLLPHECFSHVLISQDNYEDFADRFAIENYEDFVANVGAYLGREITTLDPIRPSWCGKEPCVDWQAPISLVRSLDLCLQSEGALFSEDGAVMKEVDFTEYAYSLLKPVSIENCQKLAPSLDGTCKEAYLIESGDYSGGSAGWHIRHAIYGLYELKDGRDVIAPLKNFENLNYALNYIDRLRAGEE